MSERLSIVGVWIGVASATLVLALLTGFTDYRGMSAGLAALLVSAAALWCIGIGILLANALWCRSGCGDDNHRRFRRALRHGVWIGLMLLALALLQWQGLLLWWTGLLAVGVPLLAEAYTALLRRAW